MSKRLFLIALAGLVPAIASCATTSGTPPTGPVTLQVTNAYPQSVDVYVLFDGFKQRMGTVSTAQEASFQVPDRALDSVTGVHVVIDPIGSTTGFVTGRVYGIEPGSTIDVEVASDLGATWWQVHHANPTPSATPQPEGSGTQPAAR